MHRNTASLAYADLQPQDFLEALEDLGFRCNGRLLALNSYENRVYQVGIDDDDAIVAKFYRPNRWSDAAILEEHEFATELAQQEIPVIAPMNIAGTTLHKVGDFRVAVYPCRGGRAPDLDNFELLEQLGRFVARIHLLGATATFRHRPGIDIDSYAIESMDFLLEHDFIPFELVPAYESVANNVIDGVEALFERAGDVAQIRIHGDFHPGNVLVAREQLHIVEALRSLRIMHYAAWLARRWEDPAFKQAFPWFDSQRYWEDHILALREQLSLMQEQPLEWRPH